MSASGAGWRGADWRGAGRIGDALARGFGRAAAAAGVWCELYRPADPLAPLAAAARVMRLPALFAPAGGARAGGFAGPAWWGTFDSAYTRVGDYLVRAESRDGAGDGGVWFVAAQEVLAPAACVRTARVLDLARPAGAGEIGRNGYGGVARGAAAVLLRGWPAAVTAAGRAGARQADLPADVPAGGWQVLLPVLPGGVVPRGGDIVTDDLGRRAVVTAAEASAAGWRLFARQAGA
jgi:hypothetical protein